MIKRSYHNIRVHEGDILTGGILIPKFKNLRFLKGNTKRYDNHTHLLAKLTPSAALLLNYLVDHAEIYDNSVNSNASERLRFINFLKKNCGMEMKDETVKKAFSKLHSVGFLLKMKTKGSFIVNPKYFYKGPEKNRKRILQDLCTHAFQTKGKEGQHLKKSLGI